MRTLSDSAATYVTLHNHRYRGDTYNPIFPGAIDETEPEFRLYIYIDTYIYVYVSMARNLKGATPVLKYTTYDLLNFKYRYQNVYVCIYIYVCRDPAVLADIRISLKGAPEGPPERALTHASTFGELCGDGVRDRVRLARALNANYGMGVRAVKTVPRVSPYINANTQCTRWRRRK